MTTLSADWITRLVEGSATAEARPGLDARIALCEGRTTRHVLEIRDGRIVDAGSEADADVELTLTGAQWLAVAAGELSLARGFMRGDVKPVGATGALAAALEVLEDPRTWSLLRF
jgi:putative sterol carrier protein